MSSIRLTQRRSRNGCDERQLATLRSLGLRRIGHTVEVSDTPQVRGMIAKVAHLVEVAEPAEAGPVAGSPGGEPGGKKS